MSKLFVFAIGGTGERVLRSFTMLLASGVPTFNNYEVYPIIIDYDQDNADKNRTVEVLQNYSEVHGSAFKRHTSANDPETLNGQFFAAKLKNLNGLENFVFPFRPDTNEKFREHIGYADLAGRTKGTSALLKSLYDESNRPDTELNLDMTVGFKGNPNIGSVVFHTIGDTDEFTRFKSVFNPNQGDKVVVIGSLFGGTGASGIPEIVKAISNAQPEAKIATLLVLPYFSPQESRDGAIKASRFNSKTKAALSFYNNSGLNGKIDKIYYVGDPFSTVVKYSEGGKDQKNNANLVELIAAMMIEHYAAGRQPNKREFKFSIDANIVVSPNERSGERLFISDFDDLSRSVIMDNFVKLAIGLKFHKDYICKGKADDTVFFKNFKSYCNECPELDALKKSLEAFYDKYQAWMKELDYDGGENNNANSHRFALCDMTRDYSEIILKKEEATNAAGKTLSKKVKGYIERKKQLTDDNLSTFMNTAYDKNHYDITNNTSGHEPEWVFENILNYSAKEGFEMITRNN